MNSGKANRLAGCCSADGKTQKETAHILAISFGTVIFHVKNAVSKLGTTNKTEAVVRAAVLGIIS